MKISSIDTCHHVDEIRNSISKAQGVFDRYMMDYDPDWYSKDHASYNIETVFLKLLVAAEAAELSGLQNLIQVDISEALSSKWKFAESIAGPEEPLSKWLGRAWQHVAALSTLSQGSGSLAISKDLIDILKNLSYSITDERAFGRLPQSEDDVHTRVEAILRCVFPDLRHKPPIPKPIKNFEADTGLPSIQTLIDYKFIDTSQRAKQVAEELLADTRGYIDSAWTSFVFVIYETKRFMAEHQWQQLLEASEVAVNTSVVVLSGTPAAKAKRGKAAATDRIQKAPSTASPQISG